MRRLGRRLATALALAALTGPPAEAAAGRSRATFSHAGLDSVLSRFVRDGRVDYGGLSRDHGALDRYLAAVAAAKPERWTRAEQIAFWVDAYNARVLEAVIRRPGLKSVLDVGKARDPTSPGFFAERRTTGGRELSLDDIERRILRQRFREPRVHFVLNCASVSCPKLPSRALTGARLENQLEAATRGFLADSSRNHIVPGADLALSAIFDWYGDDFRAAAGSVPAFVARHWSGPGQVPSASAVHVLPYDWSLNGTW